MIGEFFIIRRQLDNYLGRIFTDRTDRVLDIGSGKKPHYHQSIKGSVVCFDIRKHNITHVVGNADFLPFKVGSYDKAVMINSLYYFRNPQLVIDDISRLLKKGGILFIMTPFLYPIHDIPEDKFRFTEYGIRDMLKNHFIIKEIKPIGGIFNLPAILIHSLIKGTPLIFPKTARKITKFFLILALYPFYIAAQIISLMDFLDRTRRWPTYYFTVAVKK